MFVALLLLFHVMTARPVHTVALVQRPTQVSHLAHVRHERHLAHLEWLHQQHLRVLAWRSHKSVQHATVAVSVSHAAPSGSLGCAGLESLWRDAGGASWAAFTAAEIAIAESGGNQYATGAAGERGYWQIHPDHGSLSTYDAYGNARAAVIISDDGRNWSPWTTWTSGAYYGKCLVLPGPVAMVTRLAVYHARAVAVMALLPLRRLEAETTLPS